MITPADLARLMANASGDHAQNGGDGGTGDTGERLNAPEHQRSGTSEATDTTDAANEPSPTASMATSATNATSTTGAAAPPDVPHRFTPNDLAKAANEAAEDAGKTATVTAHAGIASVASAINAVHQAAHATAMSNARNTEGSANTSGADAMDDSGNNGDGHDIGASDDARDANDTNDINDPTGQADAARTEDTHGRGSADGATVAPGNAADAATENGHRPVTPAVIRQMMATTKTTNVYDSGEPMKQRQGNGTRDATEYTSIAHVARFTRVEHIGRVERGRHFIKPDGGPTPKMMPLHRHGNRPTKFATLQMQEFPVVREYSAGGLIFDEHQRVAIIARHSRSGHIEWCLPKGHIEKGETPEQTAVREVHEETGILGEVIDSIATIDYWFTGTEERIHKLVHHFALRQIGGELSVEGDPDHEAEDADWVDFKDLNSVLSYPNERKIAWLYSKKLNRQAKG